MKSRNNTAERYSGRINDTNIYSKNSIILNNIKKNSTVLECGTATGYMSEFLSTHLNCTVYGIENDNNAAQQAARWCEKIVVKNIETINFKTEFQDIEFNYIILADILEHLYDPWKILTEIVPKLSNNGKLIVSVPNISHASVVLDLINGQFIYEDSGLLDWTHIRFFTRQSLYLLIEESGLMVTDSYSVKKTIDLVESYSYSEKAQENYLKIIKRNIDWDTYQFVVIAEKQKECSKNMSPLDKKNTIIATLEKKIIMSRNKVKKTELVIDRLNNHIVLGFIIKIFRAIKNDKSFGNYN